ncbi:MAG: ORF6N domain-containing protein [Magnetococcales bacterium]|nr:ORF6N domain-containing protein [Magnetococcales bacterium]
MNAIIENSNPVITIGAASVPVIEYRGKRVVTFAMVDQVHQRPEGTARKRFNDNKERFIAEEDFFHLSFHDVASLSEFRTAGLQPNSQGLVVLTQSGYLMLVKSFTDDLAWQVQRELVNRYFQTLPTSAAHQVYLMAKAVWEQELRVRHLEQTSDDQQRQIDAIARRQDDMDGDTGYMTALAFCRRESVPAPLSLARRLGVMASEMCRELGIRTGRVPDERWGAVNSYPIEVLKECLATLNRTATAA